MLLRLPCAHHVGSLHLTPSMLGEEQERDRTSSTRRWNMHKLGHAGLPPSSAVPSLLKEIIDLDLNEPSPLWDFTGEWSGYGGM